MFVQTCSHGEFKHSLISKTKKETMKIIKSYKIVERIFDCKELYSHRTGGFHVMVGSLPVWAINFFLLIKRMMNTTNWPVSQNWPVKPGLHLHWFGLTQSPFMHFGWQIAFGYERKKMIIVLYSTISVLRYCVFLFG